jgi:hypothetical protein
MIYIILDPKDCFIHMVTTDRKQAEREYRELDDPAFVLRQVVDEGLDR